MQNQLRALRFFLETNMEACDLMMCLFTMCCEYRACKDIRHLFKRRQDEASLPNDPTTETSDWPGQFILKLLHWKKKQVEQNLGSSKSDFRIADAAICKSIVSKELRRLARLSSASTVNHAWISALTDIKYHAHFNCLCCDRYLEWLKHPLWVDHDQRELTEDMNLELPTCLVVVKHRLYNIIRVGVFPADKNETARMGVALWQIGALPAPPAPSSTEVATYCLRCKQTKQGLDKKAVTKLRPVLDDLGWRIIWMQPDGPRSLARNWHIACVLNDYVQFQSESTKEYTVEQLTQVADTEKRAILLAPHMFEHEEIQALATYMENLQNDM